MEMGFENRAVIIGVNMRGLERPLPSQHVFADILLIDKSHGILNPLLYQLKREALPTDQHWRALEPNAFVLMGEALTIDKKKKQVYLSNDNTVTYKHLVLASGLSQTSYGAIHEEELAAGFHALMEAIKVSSQAAALSYLNQFPLKKRKTPTLTSAKMEEDPITPSVVKTLASDLSSKSLDMALAGTERRLYEVQL